MNKTLVGLAFILFSSICHALTCPTNFSIVNEGESIESVRLKCGKPDEEKKSEVDKPVPQEWTYFITETVATSSSYQTTGTLKTTITFNKEDKAINISVNGIGVGESTICGNPIRLNDTRDSVKQACGKPSFINKETNESGEKNVDTIITFIYKNPPGTFTFKNGKLVSGQ